MRLHRRQFLHVAAGIGTLPAVSHIANAQTYPSRPVRLIVGFTPGAASDIIGRVFAKGAGPILGQEVVVENKPGAGSSIAAEYVARADKDGYTLFVPALSTLTDEIVAGRAVDMSKDFAPIALLGNLAIVLVVNPQANVHSVGELIALAKSKPGKLLYATVGAGTLPHLCAVLFEQRTGLNLLHVPYPGSPQAITDVIAGRVTMFFAPATVVVGQIASGKVTALATAANNRSSALPEVPTISNCRPYVCHLLSTNVRFWG